MFNLVCDFCTSMRLGTQVGYREFKKAFDEARQVRIYANEGNFIRVDLGDSIEGIKVQQVRELAQRNYKESKEDDLHIPQ